MLVLTLWVQVFLGRRLRREGRNSLAEMHSSQAKCLQVKHQEDQAKDFLLSQTKERFHPHLLPPVTFFPEQPHETKPHHPQRQTLTCHLRKQTCSPPARGLHHAAEGRNCTFMPQWFLSLKKNQRKRSLSSSQTRPFSTSAGTNN